MVSGSHGRDLSSIKPIILGTMWGPQSIAKLVNITTSSLGFMVVITIVRWGYKPTYNVWGPHIVPD
jgi:hypothetical protein